MSRAALWSLAVMALVAGFLGFHLGTLSAVTESDVIEAGAAAYVAETGGQREACYGRPGAGVVWIVVTCQEGELEWQRSYDRRGLVVRMEPQA